MPTTHISPATIEMLLAPVACSLSTCIIMSTALPDPDPDPDPLDAATVSSGVSKPIAAAASSMLMPFAVSVMGAAPEPLPDAAAAGASAAGASAAGASAAGAP